MQKKLQEISQLKEKRDILNEEQKTKVSKEGDLQKDADELQSRLIALKKCFVCFTLKFLVWNNGMWNTVLCSHHKHKYKTTNEMNVCLRIASVYKSSSCSTTGVNTVTLCFQINIER